MKNTPASFYTLVSVFFFWGFIAASNGVFIPFCKARFHLSQFESQLIDTAFYLAYFIGSLILFGWNKVSGINILEKYGYKKGILFGLFISIGGALCMIPSVHAGNFIFILGSFFLIGLGFSLQQTTAQPYVIALGDPEKGAFRLNFAGGVNSLGTLLGPLMVAFILFGNMSAGKKAAENAQLASIDLLYIILSVVFALAFILLYFAKLPQVQEKTEVESKGALRFPSVRWGMLAIFVYVGVEVTIQSNLGQLLKERAWGAWSEDQIDKFIAVYWGSLMIGRWTGAIDAFSLSKTWKNILTVFIPILAFSVVIGVNHWKGNDMNLFFPYIYVIGALIIGIFITRNKPAAMLLYFGIMGAVAMIIGLSTVGNLSVFAFLSGGLACSIMWPCIFSLSLKNIGPSTSEGSALLIMMILGGAVIPPIQGALADTWGILPSYLITLPCFIYLVWFAWKVPSWNRIAAE